jgi:hypothetical protein
MKPIDILRKIIDNGGQCEFATPNICIACPLSKLKANDRGTYLGCIEAIGILDLKQEEADKKYLEVAQKRLIDLEIEDILGPTNDIE